MEPQLRLPARFTPSLSGTEDFPTDGDELIRLIEKYWIWADGTRAVLLPHQKWFLRHALEKFPDDWPDERVRGHLRYRAVLLSIGRQNTKSTLASFLALYLLLLHTKNPQIVGISESVAHAKAVVYGPLQFVVNNVPAIGKHLRATETRGIQKRDGTGSYTYKPAVESKLQGLAVKGGAIVDEIHLLRRGSFDSLVNGQRAQQHSIIFGLTTAGDDTSELLLSLYARTDAAIADPASDLRFGSFIWEAPDGAALDDPEAIKAANPAVEGGLHDLATITADTAHEPDHTRRRYLLNQFVANTNQWLPITTWVKNRGREGEAIRDLSTGVWYCVDMAPGQTWASIAAAKRNADGFIETELVASIKNPTVPELKALADQLPHTAAGFIIETYSLKDLADHLESRGRKVVRVSSTPENVRVYAAVYSLLSRSQVRHANDPIVNAQVPLGVAKNVGEGSRLIPHKRKTPLDALYATQFAIYAAHIQEQVDNTPMVISRRRS